MFKNQKNTSYSCPEEILEVGRNIRNYLMYLKNSMLFAGMFNSSFNLFPDLCCCCFQVSKNSGESVAYADSKFLNKFRFWIEIAGMSSHLELAKKINPQIFEFQKMYQNVVA